MKICVFTPGDGQAIHLQRIVPALAHRGLEMHVVSAKAGTVPGATGELFRVPPRSLTNPRGWHGRWKEYLAGFMRRFDVVHLHFLHDWGFTPDVIRQGCLVATPWGSDIVQPPGEGKPSPELIEARTTMLRNATAVTAWGPYFARTIARYAGIDADGIDVVPVGIDLEQFQPRERASRRDGPEFHVGCCKGFREVYGPTYLIEAVPLVLEALPLTNFHLIGDGAQYELCRNLARKLNVDAAIEWIPRLDHSEIPEHLAAWDVSVVPSVCESFGVAALESAAMAVPVVATRAGALSETVRDAETGVLVPPEDPRALAKAIVALLGDSALRSRMGQAGRSFVEREYEWQATLDGWIKTYEAALDRVSNMV